MSDVMGFDSNSVCYMSYELEMRISKVLLSRRTACACLVWTSSNMNLLLALPHHLNRRTSPLQILHAGILDDRRLIQRV